jgi:hypothetical protein
MSWDHYINRADITDNVIKIFIDKDADSLDGYFTETDAYLEDVAETIGVSASNISVDVGGQVIPFIAKRFCIAYLCMRVCQDKASTNNVESSPDMDKYYVKHNMYYRELIELKKQLTPEVLVADVNSIADRASEQTSYLFRS